MAILLQVALHHAPFMAMFGVAWRSGRSLGAWPVYLAAWPVHIAAIGGLFAARTWTGIVVAEPVWMLSSSLEMMLPPSLLFVMARLQCIAGLRRGQMTEADRMRWIARHGLADVGVRR